MKAKVELKVLTSKKSIQGKLKILVQVGEYMHFESDWAVSHRDAFSFFEINKLRATSNEPNFISFSVINHRSQLLSKETIFTSQAREQDKIKMYDENKKHVFSLYYHYEEERGMFESRKLITKTQSKIKKEEEDLSSGKVEILNMGLLMFKFSQRLDPLVAAKKQVLDIFRWKNPTNTIICGIILSFMVYYPQVFVLIVSLGIIFGKSVIFKSLQNTKKWPDPDTRLMVDQQNFKFIEQGMKMHCMVYDSVSKVIRDHDKTEIVRIIQMSSKFGLLLFFATLIMGIQNCIVLFIWGMLLIKTKTGEEIANNLKPAFSFFNELTNAFMFKMTRQISSKLRKSGCNDLIEKEYYYVHYERWWVGKQWVDAIHNKNSDENGEFEVIPKVYPPEGMVWATEWEIDYTLGNGCVDAEGYQYSNDFTKGYKADLALKTVRRRRFKRKCVYNNKQKPQ